jgi:hypothetical protein
MNVIFGTAFPANNTQPLQALKEQACRQFSDPVEDLFVRQNFCMGKVTDNGAVLGSAQKGQISLTLLGSLAAPIPNWSGESSPLDDPNSTAKHLIELYFDQGLSFLDHIHGQYAIVIFDEKIGQTFLAVDKAELRSLFYFYLDGQLIFSSNQYLLASSLKDKISYNRSYEDFFLIYGFLPTQETFFEGIKSLKPGSILQWDGRQELLHDIHEVDPWETSFAQTDWSSLDEDQAVDVVYDAFLSALKDQCTDEKRVAVLLGGFDSALVASALVRLGKEVETFTFSYETETFNQAHVGTLQNFLGHKHHWVKITEKHLQEGLENYAPCYNRPTNWPNYIIQTRILCDEIRKQGMRFCYSGDGCDGVFMGYPVVHLRSKLFSAPFKIPKFVLTTILLLAQLPLWERLGGHVFTVVLNVLRGFARPWPERGHLTLRIFDEIGIKRLRQGNPPPQAFPLDDLLNTLSSGLEDLTPARLAYLGKGAISPNKVKIAGSSDSSGVAIHAPYMHAGMASFARSIPDALCRPEEGSESSVTGKYILMKMAEKKGLLPYDCIYQKKFAAVDAPIDDWYEGPLKPGLLKILGGLPFSYNARYVEEMMRQKGLEKLYKKHLAPDQICSSHTISLLVTYASFTQVLKD